MVSAGDHPRDCPRRVSTETIGHQPLTADQRLGRVLLVTLPPDTRYRNHERSTRLVRFKSCANHFKYLPIGRRLSPARLASRSSRRTSEDDGQSGMSPRTLPSRYRGTTSVTLSKREEDEGGFPDLASCLVGPKIVRGPRPPRGWHRL